MMPSCTRRTLEPIEIKILEAAGRLKTDVKREIYGCFYEEYSMSFLYGRFNRLVKESYLKLHCGKRRSRWALSAKAKNAVKSAKACTSD